MTDAEHPYAAPPSAAADAAPRVSVESLRAMKAARRPVVMVTAYDVVSGAVARAAGVDVVLVGDSAANVVLGYESTREIALDELLSLAAAARRGVDRAGEGARPLVVGDLPWGTYEPDDATAVATARRFVREAGCDAVKLEGGGEAMVARARAIVAEGIPVMGHVGLLPQSVAAGGALKVQGRDAGGAAAIVRDAEALDRAGCFAIVLEAVPTPLARLVTPRVGAPTIGIGAGDGVDGQVLVYHDLLGLHQGRRPRFVKRYAALHDAMVEGVAAFAREVRDGTYPGEEHGYGMDEGELRRVEELILPQERP